MMSWRTLKKQSVKCSPKKFCVAMDRALEDEANAHKKGLSTVVVVSILTVDRGQLIGVAFKKTSRDRGLMLNFCPWCGEAILWENDDVRDKKTQRRRG